MIIRKFAFNKNGKVEFTWEELKKLLDEVYLEGQKESEIRFLEPTIAYFYYPSYPSYLLSTKEYDSTCSTTTTNLNRTASDLTSLEKEDILTSGENSNA